MPRVVHVIGNGDGAAYYKEKERKGLKLCCNVPPFEIYDMYATCIVDFKMMNTIHQGIATPPGEWILGMRPSIYCDKNPEFYVKIAPRIKEFYKKLPKYAANYTDFNCGHMATYYAAEKLKADKIHMWGFDSIFDFNLRSYTDLVINSDRGNMNNNRLSNNWRPLWANMFKDFNKTEFVLHHFHDAIKFKITDNVKIEVHSKKGLQSDKTAV